MPIDNKLLFEVFQVLPRGLYLKDSAHIQRVLTAKQFVLPGGVELDLAGDWKSVASLPRSLQRRLHMHCFVGDLLPDYYNNAAALQLCLELASHWAQLFSYEADATLMAYHDETTARRIGYWLRIFVLATTSGNEEAAQTIRQLLLRELAVLVRDEFFAGLNNHGMFQDLTILYAAVLGLADEALGKKSIARLQHYLLASTTPDGVHKEHSPAYHFMVAGQFFANIPLISRMSPRAGAEVSEILQRMGRYAVDIALPTGELPPIGDTSQVARPQNYKDVFFLKEEDTHPKPWAVYKDGGYAIFRTAVPSAEEGVYALFIAAHHCSYHKHWDDLSLLLYRRGWILFESGPFGYDYAHPHSLHAYSNFSHNTLVIDNIALFDREQGIGHVSITDHGETADGYYVEGVNLRIPGVIHNRRVSFSRDGKSIEVLDRLSTDAPHQFALLWHTPLFPVLSLGHDVHSVKLGDAATLTIQAEEGADLPSVRVMHGNDDPVYKSQFYPEMGRSVEASVVVVKGELHGERQLRTTIKLI